MRTRQIAHSAAVLLWAWLGTGVGVARAEAQRSHIGPHAGYNFDFDEALIGAQAHLPLTRSVELYPSFDYYFVDGGKLLGFNGDLKFRAPGGPLYFGGGVNVPRATSGGNSSSETGINLFGGFETRYGVTHPYLEARGLLHDNTSFQLLFGLNMTLY